MGKETLGRENMTQQVKAAMMAMTRQCWEQGMVAQTLWELKDESNLSMVVHDMVLRQSADGRLCNVENTPAVTDSAFCIPATYLYGIRRKKEEYREAALRNVRFLLTEAEAAEDGTLFHMRGTSEIWADSCAYLPYAFAVTGYKKEAWKQMKGITDRLYDPGTGLYFHIWDEKSGTYLRPLPWGVGNGWILTGLLRMLSFWKETPGELPEAEEEMRGMFRHLLERMLEMEAPEHGFHDILNDPTAFEESETAAMVAYAIYRGIREGEVSSFYQERADAIRERLLSKITPDGLVWDACSSPFFDRPGTAVECQAHVLLMEQEYERILG